MVVLVWLVCSSCGLFAVGLAAVVLRVVCLSSSCWFILLVLCGLTTPTSLIHMIPQTRLSFKPHVIAPSSLIEWLIMSLISCRKIAATLLRIVLDMEEWLFCVKFCNHLIYAEYKETLAPELDLYCWFWYNTFLVPCLICSILQTYNFCGSGL